MVDIERLRLINIDPNIAREPCDIIEYDKMHGNGRYLANELSRILQKENYKYELESLLSQAVPSFQDLHISTPQVDFRRTIQIHSNECNFSSANLSDGTIKLIGVLVAIINQDNYTVIIEELENYLHPNVNRLLIDYLRESFVNDCFVIKKHTICYSYSGP
jgi:predicted ATPase